MTAQEMHISIDQDLQVINSQVNKNILPEEKDWFLNREVNRYLIRRKSPNSNAKGTGFQDDAKRVEDLKDFIRTKSLDIQESNEGDKYVILPPNYFDYIRADALVSKRCSDIPVTKITGTTFKSIFKINLNDLTTLDNFEITMTTISGTVTVFDTDDLPDSYIVTSDFRHQKFMIIKALLILLEKEIKEKISPNISLYWERYGEDFLQDTFILYSDIAIINISVIINDTTLSTSSLLTDTTTYNKEDLRLRSSIRIIDDEFFTDVNNSALSRPRINSLTGVFRQGVLIAKEPDSVVLGKIDLVYICKPNLIDLHLNNNLNASRKVCEEIVSNTVRTIKMLIENNNYDSYVKENMLIE